MKILAIDIGTRTGWAISDGKSITTGFVDFKNSRFEGGGMRYLKFKQWLQAAPLPGVVYFETVRRHKGVDAAHVYGGLLATLTSWCEEHGIPYSGVSVQAIKQCATGKGNASKQAMIDAANATGRRIKDDNEADAFWIVTYALREMAGERTTEPVEVDIFE